MTTLRSFHGIRSRLLSSRLYGATAIAACACAFALVSAPAAHSQTQSAKLTAPAATLAPVPDSPLEMVTQPARVLTSQDERAAALALFEHARQNLSLRNGVPAFQMKVSFMSSGQTQFEGDGSMEAFPPARVGAGPRKSAARRKPIFLPAEAWSIRRIPTTQFPCACKWCAARFSRRLRSIWART